MEPSIVELALESGRENDFELFAQGLLQTLIGVEFEPTGGMHDGGQDGFLRPLVGRPTHYVQISTQATYRDKIYKTIKDISKGGRKIEALTYVSSLPIPDKDIVESDVQLKTGVSITIRDRRWITLQLSARPETENIFLDRYADVLRGLKAATDHVQKRLATSERLSVLVYLDQHERSEPEQSDLLPLAVDAAIFMALKDTNPEEKILRTDVEIVQFVERFFPAIKTRAAKLVPDRLAHLRTKKGNPRIRFHSPDQYALPYEVRSEFSAQNALLRQVEGDFWISIRARINEADPTITQEFARHVEDAVSFGITRTFEQQGMNLVAAYQGNDTFEEIRTYEYVKQSIAATGVDARQRIQLERIASDVLRRIFYSGNTEENQYLYRLFKLYSVDFIIRGDENVWRYFRNLAKGLRLIVGTDIIVRALSESCVVSTSRASQNALRILKDLGVQLILTEHVLHEVYTHIRSTDREFDTFYRSWAASATLDEIKQSPKILIRSFFYARLEPHGHVRSPSSWDEFLNQFGAASWFRDDTGEASFAAYLQGKFGLTFLSRRQVETLVPRDRAESLAKKMLTAKHDNEALAFNDASMLLYVHEMRIENNEHFGSGLHGYSTWWLTEEHHAIEIARAHGLKDRLKMHPQFLMNFVAAIPGVREVAAQNSNSFPTVFGLRITNRVGDETFKEFLRSANEAAQADPAASGAKIRDLSNKLMARRH